MGALTLQYFDHTKDITQEHHAWLNHKKNHTCSCGHVWWAHWSTTGQCQHCNCKFPDCKPEPPYHDNKEVVS